MLSRSASAALILSFVGATIASAQTPAPTDPGAPPAAPAAAPAAAAPQAAPQGSPRHTATVTLGAATLTLEHGQPPWSDQRLGQMAQMAQQGQAWRMGSENATTLEVTGGPVFFGDELVQPGRYGMNLQPAGENAFSFVVFEPLHLDQSPQMLGDEPNQLIPTVFKGDAAELTPALLLDFVVAGDTAACTLSWGPLRATAPLAAAGVSTAEIELNGNPADTTWYRRALAEGFDCSKPMIAGKIDFAIDEQDCSMNVYVMLEGDQLVAVMRNREREQAEAQTLSLEAGMKQFDAAIQQFGEQAAAQIAPLKRQAQRQLVKNELTLEDTVNLPDNLKFSAPCEAGKPGALACEIFQTRRSINLEVLLGGKKGVVRIDESLFAVKSSS